MEDSTLFRPDFADAADAADAAPLWPLLRQAMSGGFSAQRTWLVRWAAPTDGGHAQASDDDRARDVVRTVEEQAPKGTVCLRYDATAVLILATDGGWPGPASEGALGGDIEVWQAVAVADDGLYFRRFAEEPESAPAATPPQARKSMLVLSDAEYTFFPLWDVAANQVFAYLCRAAWSGSDGRQITEGSPEIRGAPPERLAAIDLALFRAATSFVQDALDNYGSVDVVIPVHCGVFSSQRAITTLFDTIGREIWPVLENVSFELIPEPAPESFGNVEATIEQLVSFGCRVMLRVEADDDLTALPAAEWLSIGIEPSWSVGDDDVVPLLDEFAARVRDLGYATHVFGLAGTPATVSAVNAGFAFVGSDAIAAPLSDEDDTQAQPADILKAILASRAAR